MTTQKIYGNTPCFLGSERIESNDMLRELDVVVYGVPWEGAVTWGDYTGCELGPKVMRLKSARYSGYLPELDHIDVFQTLKMGDYGDVSVVPNDSAETMKRIEAFSKNIWAHDVFPVALGGDHGITYPIIKGLIEQRNVKVGIIHLDAHYDNMPAHEGEKYARNTPFARIYELDGVRNESLIHTGIHGPRNKPESGHFAREAGAVTISSREIRASNNLQELAEHIYNLANKDVDVVYLSICSDVLDFAFNPGGPPDGNGLTSHELLTLVHEFCKKGIVGMDFVEIYPRQEPNEFSAHLASTIILYALAGVVRHNKAKQTSTK